MRLIRDWEEASEGARERARVYVLLCVVCVNTQCGLLESDLTVRGDGHTCASRMPRPRGTWSEIAARDWGRKACTLCPAVRSCASRCRVACRPSSCTRDDGSLVATAAHSAAHSAPCISVSEFSGACCAAETHSISCPALRLISICLPCPYLVSTGSFGTLGDAACSQQDDTRDPPSRCAEKCPPC